MNKTTSSQNRHQARRVPLARSIGGVEPLEKRCLLSAAADYVAGELLVSFRSGVTQTDIAQFYAQNSFSEREALDGQAAPNASHLKLVAVPAAETMTLIAELERDPRVAYAEPNYLVPTAAATPNDPTYVRDYGLSNNGFTGGTADADIDADEAWDITTGGRNIVVAVIDTGVDYTHPDLAANMWHNPGEVEGNGLDDDGNGFVDDFYGYDFANDDSDPIDDLGHGTHVAGTIGMAGNNDIGSAGVNWNARIMALKTDAGLGNSIADLINAYNYLVMMRGRGVDVRVTNNSYGTFEVGNITQSWKQAIDAMGQAGILFVAAAGNEAQMTDTETHYPSGFDSPSIIAVAATDHNDRYASFSNWGANSVDLAAPGESVWSTVPGGYDWFNGTSMATPHVAGAAALVWSAFPNLSATEVKARLLNGADPIGSIGANASYPTLTNGRLNVRNALVVPVRDNDTTAPAAVGNLAVSASSPWSATLTWTASGDDGATGRAGFYDVRYSTAPITAATWAAANPAISEPAPRQAGSAESVVVTGLEPHTSYYFTMKVMDNAGNESPLSNLAQGNTTAAALRFNDDMEGGAANWTADDLWHRSGLRAHDSATAWYFGQEATRTYFTGGHHSGAITLASPVDLSGVSQAQLRFREWRQVIDSTPLDVARVEVSRDGSNWTSLSDSFFSSYDWQQRTLDLTPFVGGPLHVRFKFDTNAFNFLPFAIAQGFEGWYVDDVQVLVPAAQPAGFSVNDVTVTEGNDGARQAVFTVSQSGAGGPASVRYATAGRSATAAADYQSASGILTFAPGESRKTVSVPIHGDRLAEADESFVVNLSNPTGAVIADPQGKARILDDEPRIHLTTVVVFPEGNERQTILVAANLSVPSSQTVTVNYATADGTATAGSDYRAQAGTLTFNPGQTRRTIAITLPKDKQPEAIVEAFFVNLSNVSNNAVILRRGNISIVDDDPAQRSPDDDGQTPLMISFADRDLSSIIARQRAGTAPAVGTFSSHHTHNNFEGWYVDDVNVFSGPMPAAAAASLAAGLFSSQHFAAADRTGEAWSLLDASTSTLA